MAEIVVAPSEVLSQKAKEVGKVDSSIAAIVTEMKDALINVKDIIGVGLAAPQIGVSLRIFIMRPDEKGPIQTLINPKILHIAEPKDHQPESLKGKSVQKARKNRNSSKLEGCLSLNNIWGTVVRSPKVKISYIDEQGKNHTRTFIGFRATIVQHEMDHLDGILFPRRVLEQKGKLYQSHRNKKGEDVFDEITL